jgi:hypothetical protein
VVCKAEEASADADGCLSCSAAGRVTRDWPPPHAVWVL